MYYYIHWTRLLCTGIIPFSYLSYMNLRIYTRMRQTSLSTVRSRSSSTKKASNLAAVLIVIGEWWVGGLDTELSFMCLIIKEEGLLHINNNWIWFWLESLNIDETFNNELISFQSISGLCIYFLIIHFYWCFILDAITLDFGKYWTFKKQFIKGTQYAYFLISKSYYKLKYRKELF